MARSLDCDVAAERFGSDPGAAAVDREFHVLLSDLGAGLERHWVVALHVAAERVDVEGDTGRWDGEHDVAGVRVKLVTAGSIDGTAESRVAAHGLRADEGRLRGAEDDFAAGRLGIDIAGDIVPGQVTADGV